MNQTRSEMTTDELLERMTSGIVFIRGAQGSGKSTWAWNRYQQIKATRQQVDVFLLDPDDGHFVDGVYQWSRENHLPNLDRFGQRAHDLATNGALVLFPEVLATAVELRRVSSIYDGPEAYPYLFIRCTGEYDNLHGVPAEVVQEVRDSIVPVEGEVFV